MGDPHGYTVLIDDGCGTTKAYHTSASSAKGACSFAKRVFDAHTSTRGNVVACLQGEPVFLDTGNLGSNPIEVIYLYQTDEDPA